ATAPPGKNGTASSCATSSNCNKTTVAGRAKMARPSARQCPFWPWPSTIAFCQSTNAKAVILMRVALRLTLTAVILNLTAIAGLTFAQAIQADLVVGQVDAAKPIVEGPFVKLVNVASGKVLAIAGDSDMDRTEAVLGSDEKNQTREWKIVQDGEFFRILNRHNSKSIDVDG